VCVGGNKTQGIDLCHKQNTLELAQLNPAPSPQQSHSIKHTKTNTSIEYTHPDPERHHRFCKDSGGHPLLPVPRALRGQVLQRKERRELLILGGVPCVGFGLRTAVCMLYGAACCMYSLYVLLYAPPKKAANQHHRRPPMTMPNRSGRWE